MRGGAEEGDFEFGGIERKKDAELRGWEWRLLHSWLGGDQEFLVVGRDVQVGLYRCGEILQCSRCREMKSMRRTMVVYCQLHVGVHGGSRKVAE